MAGLVALILSRAGAPRVRVVCKRSMRPLASFSPSATPAAFHFFHFYMDDGRERLIYTLLHPPIQLSPVSSSIGFPFHPHLILQRLLAGCFG